MVLNTESGQLWHISLCKNYSWWKCHVLIEVFCSLQVDQFPNILHFFGRRSAVTAYWPCLVMWLYFSGAVQLMSSNYDAVIRVFVCNNFSLIKSFCFPWAVKVWCIFTLSCRCSQSLLFAVKLWFWMVAYFCILLTFSRSCSWGSPSTEEIFEGFMLVQCCMWLSELALIVILLHYVFLLCQHSSLADC